MNPSECLEQLKTIAKEYKISGVAYRVLEDPRFYIASGSGSKNKHHYGNHGLLFHTTEVVNLCLLNADQFPESHIDRKVLYLGALFHDYGKCWDYERIDSEVPFWRKTSHSKNIHHVSRSAVEWGKIISLYPVYAELENPVLHMILSHHGTKEYGSPVAPTSREAWLLHLCDGISARIDDCQK